MKTCFLCFLFFVWLFGKQCRKVPGSAGKCRTKKSKMKEVSSKTSIFKKCREVPGSAGPKIQKHQTNKYMFLFFGIFCFFWYLLVLGFFRDWPGY